MHLLFDHLVARASAVAGQRPRHRGAAEQRDELATLRGITLVGRSARLVRWWHGNCFIPACPVESMDLVVVLPNQFDVAGILNGLRSFEPLFIFIQQFLLVSLRDRLIGGDLRNLFFIAVCGSVYCLLCGSIPANTIKMLAATSSYSAKSLKPFFSATLSDSAAS
jgi:hypothetical protein